jgi:hypothetical protein
MMSNNWSSNSALDPGGQFQFPTVKSDTLLYLTVQARYTIFLESDGSGSFIVDATISHIFGKQSPEDPRNIPADHAKVNLTRTRVTTILDPVQQIRLPLWMLRSTVKNQEPFWCPAPFQSTRQPTSLDSPSLRSRLGSLRMRSPSMELLRMDNNCMLLPLKSMFCHHGLMVAL